MPNIIDPTKPIKTVTYNGVTVPLEPSSEDKDFIVRVVDYDNNIIDEGFYNEGETYTLPLPPTHQRLVFQEWSCPVAINNNSFIVDRDTIIGPTYTTESGLCEFVFRLNVVTGLTVTLNAVGTKNWGDGVTDTLTTHTYSQYGDYIATCNCSEIGGDANSTIFGSNPNFCIEANFTNIALLSYVPGTRGVSVFDKITLSNTVTSIGAAFLVGMYTSNLKTVIVPKSVTTLNDSFCSNTLTISNVVLPHTLSSAIGKRILVGNLLEYISLPNSLTSVTGNQFLFNARLIKRIPKLPAIENIQTYFLQQCPGTGHLVIPQGVVTVNSTFSYCGFDKMKVYSSVTSLYLPEFCPSLIEIDLTEYNSPPTLLATADSPLRSDCVIKVKATALSAFQTATNWVSVSNYMVGV